MGVSVINAFQEKPMPLTDTAIKKIEPGVKPTKIVDERGLYLLVNPNRAELWRRKFRVDGRVNLMAFEGYPDVSVAQVREARNAVCRYLATRLNPASRGTSTVVSEIAVCLSCSGVIAQFQRMFPKAWTHVIVGELGK